MRRTEPAVKSKSSEDILRIGPKGEDSGCSHCQNRHGFSIPHDLISDFSEGNVVVFAGAGISTENREVMPYTLHEDICSEIRADKSKIAFPDAAEQFVKKPNGRIKLVQKIIDRFKYVESFFELREEATQFHSQLATLHGVSTVVTTNWDMFFEQYCGCQPFILDADMAFWESARRRVLKIHGSISNLSTMTATREDYVRKQAELHRSLVGSYLKTLLTTKTIVFFGYSLRDDDFVEIMEFVTKSLGAFTRQHYIVTLDKDPAIVERYKSYGLEPICTDQPTSLKR